MKSMKEPDAKMSDSEKPAEKKKIDDYEVEAAAETLMKAEKIKADPELMKLVTAHLEKKKGHITSIEDVIRIRDEKFGKGSKPSKAEPND
jgi:hypothetical protein